MDIFLLLLTLNANDWIYGGEHLDHVIYGPDYRVQIGTVLLVYDPQTLDLVKQQGIYDNPLGSTGRRHLLWLRHDCVTSRNHTWYQWDEDYVEEDIQLRWNVEKLPALLYFQKESIEPPQVWTQGQGQTAKQWLLELVSFRQEIVNDIAEDVVLISGKYQKQIVAYDRATIAGRKGAVVYAQYENGTFICGWELNGVELVVRRGCSFNSLDHFQNSVNREMMRVEERLLHQVHNHAVRHLLNRKQPLIVPAFTKEGFVQMRMPEGLHEALLNYYHRFKIQRVNETWNPIDTVLNNVDVRCTIVDVQPTSQEVVTKMLQPYMEKWCNCKLEHTAFYGMREYYQGSILRNHVDRFDTHVISAVLQIHQDLGEGGEWAFEAIRYDGTREQVYLQPGHMLFYESAKVIHGRPRPFTGNVYVNAFLHFKPANNWHYATDDSSGSRHLMHPNGIDVPLEPLEDKGKGMGSDIYAQKRDEL